MKNEEIKRLIMNNEKVELTICKNCKAKFLPSLTASVKDMCHACIMANL